MQFSKQDRIHASLVSFSAQMTAGWRKKPCLSHFSWLALCRGLALGGTSAWEHLLKRRPGCAGGLAGKRLCATEAVIRGYCRKRGIIALFSNLKAKFISFGRNRHLTPSMATKECGGLLCSGLLKALAPAPLGARAGAGMHPGIHLESPSMRVAEAIGAQRHNLAQQQYFSLGQRALQGWALRWVAAGMLSRVLAVIMAM